MTKNAKAATGAYKPVNMEESPSTVTLEQPSHATSAKANQNASKHAQKKHWK
jgi:hypothetical protein